MVAASKSSTTLFDDLGDEHSAMNVTDTVYLQEILDYSHRTH